MQLLNVINARATWLFELADLNPRGVNIFPDLLSWLKETYGFEKSPASINDLDETKGLSFKLGTFRPGEEGFSPSVDVELTVYNDGLLAGTHSSTHDTDAFLLDVLRSAAEEFGLHFDPTIIRSKIYLSEITVRMEQSLRTLNPKLAQFAERLSMIHGHKCAGPFEVGGISFWADTSMAALKFAPFLLERKLNAPFSENRYYSKAPLHTDEHVRLLEDFEGLLAE
jgi:hypothetical protein